jgi:hypothetical protein
MAEEIQVTAAIQVKKGSFNFAKIGGTPVKITLVGDGGGQPGIVTIPTSNTALTFTGISAPGWIRLQNLDEDNYVEWGALITGTLYKLGKLMPGEPALFRLHPSVAATFGLIANTAACKVQANIFED